MPPEGAAESRAPSSDAAPVDAGCTEEARAALSDRRVVRRTTIRFIVVFVVSVLVLLSSYELATDTKANDWYLYRVAHSTAFLLRRVGHSCELGMAARYAGQERKVRQTLRDSKGAFTDAANAESPGDAKEEPLTAWESWRYSAIQHRRAVEEARQRVAQLEQDASLTEPGRAQQLQAAEVQYLKLKTRDIGPLVSFVLRQGSQRRIDAIKGRIQAVQSDTALTEETRSRETGRLEEELRRAEADSAQSGSAAAADLGFNFIVIPDCGAIPPMAIFVAALLAFPATWWRRLAGVVLGLPILYWVNALRLAVLAVIGAWDRGGSIFRFAHEYVWQGIYIIFVVVLWIAWVEFFVRRKDRSHAR